MARVAKDEFKVECPSGNTYKVTFKVNNDVRPDQLLKLARNGYMSALRSYIEMSVISQDVIEREWTSTKAQAVVMAEQAGIPVDSALMILKIQYSQKGIDPEAGVMTDWTVNLSDLVNDKPEADETESDENSAE